MQKTCKQEMANYVADDFQIWKILFERQLRNLTSKGSTHYIDALQQMNSVLNPLHIPDFKMLNDFFQQTTQWQIEVVPGLIPVDEFLQLLSDKKFCSSTWLRSRKNIDYLEEPDMFHDIFGHIPLLSNEVFSAFTHEFGKLGRHYIHDKKAIAMLQRLYWFTIEFGVIMEDSIKAYGAGIISSFEETNRVANQQCTFINFDIKAILHKDFRTDIVQEEYFVVDSLDQLYNCLDEVDKILQNRNTLDTYMK